MQPEAQQASGTSTRPSSMLVTSLLIIQPLAAKEKLIWHSRQDHPWIRELLKARRESLAKAHDSNEHMWLNNYLVSLISVYLLLKLYMHSHHTAFLNIFYVACQLIVRVICLYVKVVSQPAWSCVLFFF